MSPSRLSVHGWALLSRSPSCIGHPAVRRSVPRLSSFIVIASGIGLETVIARSEATKQSIVTVVLAVDCFASLAMTVGVASLLAVTATPNTTPPSRGAMRPRFAGNFLTLQSEGAGNTGCTLHPRSRVQQCTKQTHTSIQVQRRQSGIPCAMVLRLISRSPRRSGFLVTVACGLKVWSARSGSQRHRRLDAGVEASGPHDFAVRESAVRLRTP